MFELRIVPDGGAPFDVETTSRDIVRWESGGGNKSPRSMGQLVENMRMVDVTDLAWYAASRKGLTDLDIRQWREGVDVDITKRKGEKDEAAPLACPSCGAEVPRDGDEAEGDEGDEGDGSGPTRPGR